MASQVPPEQEQKQTSDGPAIICNGCNQPILPRASLFHCPFHPDGFDLCLICALDKPSVASRHELKTCVIDARDDRRTYVPGPDIGELNSIIDRMKKEPSSWKLPTRYFRFFHQSKIHGISEDDLASTERYEDADLNIATAAVTTKKIDNDYTIYEPLDREKKEIRLAILLPGSPQDPIAIALRTVPYPWDNGRWMALSYTWGSMDETRRIGLVESSRLGGGADVKRELRESITPFSCTATLEMALRGLRREEVPTHVWIDALCINQGDLEERTYQVSIMAEIYGHAKHVIVWLGTRREITSAAFHVHQLGVFLRDWKVFLDEKATVKSDHHGNKHCDMRNEFHVMEHMVNDGLAANTPLATSRLAPAIQHFFNSPWFSRAWVAQEVWAARSIMVICGSHQTSLSWETVMQANSFLGIYASRGRSRASGNAVKAKKEIPPGKFISQASGQAVWRRLISNPRETARSAPIPAIELLHLVTMQLQASDPRDLIF